MADEDLAIAETELGTPATGEEQQEVETPEFEAELEANAEGEGQEEGGGEQEQADEFDDIELDGVTYQVPKALKGAFMKNADYTQKSQANADRGRSLDLREKEIETRLQASDEELDARATLRDVDRQIAEYARLTQADWDHHHANDPMGTEKAWRNYQFLKEQRSEVAQNLETASAQRTERAQQDLAKRVQDTIAAAPTILPGTTAKTVGSAIDKLVNFATSAGIPEQALKDNWSPTLLKVLHLASLGQQVMDKQSAPKPKPNPPPAPVKVISAKSNPTSRKSPAEMSMAETAEAFRKEQAAKKAS